MGLTCFWAKGDRCTHPRIAGEACEQRCGGCVEYRGPLRGFGDVVAAAAKVTGVATVVNAVSATTGKDCGCAERRRRLNEQLPL